MESDQTTKEEEVVTEEEPTATTKENVDDEPSSSVHDTKSEEILQKINEKSREICRKLQERRLCLQKQEDEIEGNDEAVQNNDLKAKRVLKTMRDANLSKSSSAKASTCILNGSLAENVNGVALSCNEVLSLKPLYQHSKKQLEALVEGLHELLTKLTMDDSTLKTKAKHLAANINSLKSFPLFMTDVDNLPSTSQHARMRSNADVQKERHNSRRDSEMSHDSSYYAREDKAKGSSTSAKSKGATTKKDKEKKIMKTPELSPQELLLNYINAMISEYMGDQQHDNLDKIKCTLNNLEDLENYAQILVQAGLGRVVEEEIRVNRKNNRQAFITLSNDREGLERDGIVLLPVARRYAFDGDVVRAFVLHPKTSTASNNRNGSDEDSRKPRRISSNLMGGKENSICLADDEDPFDDCDSSPDTDMEENPEIDTIIISDNCPKAFVINIIKQTELREIVGSISFKKSTSLNSKTYYKLKPHDMKVPMVYILVDSCKDHIKAASKDDIVGMLYLAHVLETDNNGHCLGELLQPVGKVGNLEAEMKAILLHNGLKDLKPFEQKFYDMYDGPVPPVTEEDLKHREDLRKKCVFTIDPLTARDLDDAVSVEKLSSEDEYEIGVHISDVSHYLEENSELDNLVKERATSIYLVNEVVHMLPSSLCYRCSLLPGEDKFAFSVFWRWNLKEKVFAEPRFTRSVINSCSQFAYEHAQKIIENPEENFGRTDFPEIFNEFTPDDIKWRILLLHSISQHLKGQRYESGALSINNPKLRFTLDPVTGEPVSYEVEGRQEANYLIEEFMLLANQAVAKITHEHFPDNSILRNHAPPLQKSMRALRDRLANLDLDFDISTSKSVYESMQRLCRQSSDPKAMDACLSTLLTKPMARARYYCSEGKSSDAEHWHYALSIPIYTHFTSPIRRYPDILVHRLLAASLNYCQPPQRTSDELHQLAKICNDQKFNAKNAGDESIDLFFVRYIRAKESITLRAVVTDIFKNMLNVITIETGHTFAIPYKLQKVVIDTTHVPSHVLVSEKNSQLPPLKLQLFSTIDIRVVLRNDKTCGFIVSPDKTQRRLNSKESSKMRDKPTNNNNNNTANGFRNNHNSISEQEDVIEKKPKKVPRYLKRKEKIYAVKADE